MSKIYLCTNDSMVMDLILQGMDDEKIESKMQEIINKLEEDRYVLNVDGNYIMGGLTAFDLSEKYDISCTTHQIE